MSKHRSFSLQSGNLGVWVAGVTAAIYCLGIAVVNRNLSRYGYSSFSLLQPSYVGAGLWAIIPLVFAAIAFGAATATMPERRPAPRGRVPRALRWVEENSLIALVGTLIATGLFALQVYFGVSAGNLMLELVAGIALVYCLFEFRNVLTGGSQLHSVTQRVRSLAVISALPIAAWAYLTYASAIYSQVPSGFGGGRTRLSVLVLDSTYFSRAQLSLGGITPDSSWSISANVLLRTGEFTAVVPAGQGSVIELPPASIRFIKFSRSAVFPSNRAAQWVETIGAHFGPDSLSHH